MIEKTHPTCDHPILTKCCEQPDRNKCNKSCPLKLPCGHPCKNRCNKPCTKKCKAIVDYTKPTACGHKFKVNCYLLEKDLPSHSYELLKFCMEPCNTELPCKHVCLGTCGKCAQGRIHQACQERCETRLICGHECRLLCHETCQPCSQLCSYKCRHNMCKRQCGEPCIKCIRTCLRKCEHTECTARCWEICTVPPCSEPCQKELDCGHPCMGFCGDPCPLLCSICNMQEVLKIFPSFEGKRNVRFVLLRECNHIVESQEMEEWLKQVKEIKYKSCPKCDVPLMSTHRYSDYIKRNLTDVKEIKKQFFGHNKENEARQRELFNRLYNTRSNATTLLTYASNMDNVFGFLRKDLQSTRRERGWQQALNNCAGQMHAAKINILEIMVDMFARAKLKHPRTIKEAVKHIDLLCYLLMLKQGQGISNREMVDFKNELKRLQRIIQFYQIEDFLEYHSRYSELPRIQEIREVLPNLLFGPGNYTDKLDNTLKEKLTKLTGDVPAMEIMDTKEVEIIQIIGMGKTHWYKCLKQHYYGTNNLVQAIQCSKCSPPRTNSTFRIRPNEISSINGINQPVPTNSYVSYLRYINNLKVPISAKFRVRRQ
ncbi:hypothetical protein ILUMI_03226 [Ignelater luminosus]|uniref:NFX1-type zinc finger-containing protein 1 n=1 Tax=Ignelater luminosus TaxID=2038154 RepID=A0A8K0DG71_IGNLU|nr:hypothetical protein ILUMI_03226 [Ignelater luminosus]